VWQVVYEQTMRRAERQAVVLGELRTRASIILTATGIVASLLGAEVLKRERPFPEAWVLVGALVPLAAGVACCLAVLRPVRDKPPAEGVVPRTPTGLGRFRALLWRQDTDTREWQVTLPHERLTHLAGSAPGQDVDGLRRAIVEELELPLKGNYATIEFRSHFLDWATVFLLLQIGLWVWALWILPVGQTVSSSGR
jgi:hypothetical protein